MTPLHFMLALLLFPSQETNSSAQNPQEIQKLLTQPKILIPSSVSTSDWPRYVRISYSRRGTRWLGAALRGLTVFPHSGVESKRTFIEGYLVEFLTTDGNTIRVPAREEVVLLSSHELKSENEITYGYIQTELPEGQIHLRGFRLFAPDGALIGEQYDNPNNIIPNLLLEINALGEFKLTTIDHAQENILTIIRFSLDRGKSWSKPARSGASGGVFTKLIAEPLDLQMNPIILEFLLVKGFKVERRQIFIDGPQKGVLTQSGFNKD